jgi:hypothetical protein
VIPSDLQMDEVQARALLKIEALQAMQDSRHLPATE